MTRTVKRNRSRSRRAFASTFPSWLFSNAHFRTANAVIIMECFYTRKLLVKVQTSLGSLSKYFFRNLARHAVSRRLKFSLYNEPLLLPFYRVLMGFDLQDRGVEKEKIVQSSSRGKFEFRQYPAPSKIDHRAPRRVRRLPACKFDLQNSPKPPNL